MGLFEGVLGFIKDAGDNIAAGIGNINSFISDNITHKLGSNNSVLDNIAKGIKDNIDKKLDGNSGFFNDFIQPILDKLDFSGLLNPLAGFLKDGFIQIITSISESLGFPLKEILNNIVGLKGTKLELHSKAEIQDIFKFVNEVASSILGIKPFAIQEGSADFIDYDKKGLYYTIVQTIILALFGIKMFTGNFETFLSFPYNQFLTEYYSLNRLGLNEYIQLNRREIIDNDKLTEMSEFLGYDSDTLDNAKIITEFYPSVRDLIDFAVREAFEPDEKLFIHGANSIPIPFSEYGKKIGLKDEWIKKFWHSHWRLLGAGQILDGFHRKLIDKPFLLDYLRRLDYTEKDRELIMNMSYSLLTRVDVRRIFENGLMSSKEVFEYYKTLGFKEYDAFLMLSLAKQARFIEVKDLRKLYIEQYEAGFLTVSAIRKLLKASGLDSDEIRLYLDYSDASKNLDFKLELKHQIELRFYEGIIDFDELIDQLRNLGVSNRELERIRDNARLFDFKKPRLPTIAEIKRYWKKGIIDVQKFVYYALRLGYSMEVIEMIAKDIGIIEI